MGGEVVVDVGEAIVNPATEATVWDIPFSAVVGQGTAGDVEDVTDLFGFYPFAVDNKRFVDLLFDPAEALFDFDQKLLFDFDVIFFHDVLF